MSFWSGLLETGTEIVDGTVDVVGKWTVGTVNDKLNNKKEAVKSADPNAARTAQTEAQNKDGRAVQYVAPFLGVSNQQWALMGGGVLLLAVLLLAIKK